MKPTPDRRAIVKAAWLLNKRGQNFIYAEVGDEFRMYQNDGGALGKGGVIITGKGLAVLFSRATQQAMIYAYSPAKRGNFDVSGKPPKPCWTAFHVDLTGLGHIAMANRIGTALTEMHGIHQASGMESVSDD